MIRRTAMKHFRKLSNMMRMMTVTGVFITTVFCPSALANTITIPGTVVDTPGLGPQLFVNINIKNAGGTVITVSALVDPGDNDRLSFSAADATAIGLTAGNTGNVEGAGGTATEQTTNVPASRGGTFAGETDSNASFTASVAGAAFIGTGTNTTVGTQYFNTDPAGRGAITINYAKGTATIYDHAQALTHASLNFSTPIVVVADGSIDPDPNGSAYAANVGVTFGTTAASSLFTISTGVSSTLISIGLAQSLGIPCSGQPLSFTSELGTFAVPSAVVGVNVFAQQAGQTLEVGCLSHALDPDNINILGMDFLGQFSSIDLNAANLVFSASVPEPSTILPLGACLLGIGWILVRRDVRGPTRPS